MSKSIDERVVRMEFDNEQFEKNVAQTRNTLEKLKDALDFSKSEKAFAQVEKAANNLSFSALEKNVDTLANKLSGLGAVTTGFLFSIGNRLEQFGAKMVSKFLSPLNQIKTGGWARATNIDKAEFTIRNLVDDVEVLNAVLGDGADNVGAIMRSVDNTAYGYDQAALVASQLIASDIKDGERLESTLKSIAGIAATFNTDYDGIGRIFTQIAGQGRVMGGQLQQLSMRGMNAAATLAKYLNVTEAEVRDMASKSKIDFETFADAMYDAFGDKAFKANETFEGSLANTKSALSRIGALFAGPLRKAAIPLFNGLRVAINNVKTELVPLSDAFDKWIQMLGNAAKAILSNEDTLRGIRNITAGIVNIFGNLVATIQSVIVGMAKILFPAGSIKSFADATETFRKFTESAMLSKDSMKALADAGAGLASILKLPFTIISEIAKGILPDLNIEIGGVTNGLANLLGFIGRVTQKVTDSIGKWEGWRNIGNGIRTVFKGIATVLLFIGLTIKAVVDKIKDLTKSQEFLEGKTKAANFMLSIFHGILNGIKIAAFGVLVALYAIGSAFKFVFDKIKESKVGQVIMTGLSIAVHKVVDGFRILKNQGLPAFIGIFKTIGKGIKNIWDKVAQSQPIQKFLSIIQPLVDGIKNAFNGLSDALNFHGDKLTKVGKMWQAIGGIFVYVGKGIWGVIKNVFGALRDLSQGLTTGKIVALSITTTFIVLSVAIGKLIRALTGTADAAKGLLGSFKAAFDNKFLGKRKSTIAENLKSFALAVLALTAALSILSGLDQKKMWQSVGVIAAVAGIMAALNFLIAGTTKIFKKEGKFFDTSIMGLISFAITLGVLTKAVKTLMDAMPDDTGWALFQKVGAALVSVIALLATLTGMAIFLSRYGAQISLGSVAIVFFAFSTKKLVDALVQLENLDTAVQRENILTLMGIMIALGALAKGVGKIKLTSLGGFALLALALKQVIPSLIDLARVIDLTNVWKLLDSKIMQIAILAGTIGIVVITLAKVLKRTETPAKGVTKSIVKIKRSFQGIPGILFGIVALLGTIAIVIKSFQKMENFNYDAAWNAAALIGGILVLITGMILVLSAFGKKTKNVGSSASAIAVSCLSVIILMYEIKKLTDYISQPGFDPKAFGIAYAAIAGLVTLMTVLMVAAGKARGVAVGVIVGLVIGISVLFIEMVALTLLPLNELLVAAGSIFAVLVGLSIVLSALGKFAKSGKKSLTSIIMLTDVVLMLAMLGTILVFASMHPWQSLAATAAGMVLCLLALTYVIKTLGNLDGRKFNIKKVGPMLLITIAMMGSIGAAMSLVSNFGGNWQNIIAAAAGISLGVLAISKALTIIGGAKKPKLDSLQTFVQAVALIVPLGLAMTLISRLGGDWSSIIAASAGISLGVIAIAGALTILSKLKAPNPNQLGTFLQAVALVVPIGLAMTAISRFGGDWASIIAAAAGLSLAVAALSVCLLIISHIKDPGKAVVNALALAAASLALIPMALALSMLAKYNWSEIWPGMVGLIVVLGVLTAALAILTAINVSIVGAIAAAAALVVVSLSLLSIGFALSMLANISWGGILPGMVALISVFAVMSIALGILTAMNVTVIGAIAAAAALLIASISLMLIGNALQGLAEMPWQNIAAAALAMIGVFVTLSIVMGILTGIAMTGVGLVAMLGVAAGIMALGVAVMAAGTGMALGGAGLVLFASAMQLLQNIDLQGIGKGLITMIPGLAVLALTGLGLLAAGPGMLMIALALSMMAPPMAMMAGLDILGVAQGLLGLAAAGAALTLSSLGFMSAAFGVKLITGSVQTGATVIPPAVMAIVTAINVLKRALSGEEANNIGINFSAGITNGLQKGLPAIGTAVQNIGQHGIIGTLKNVLGIHSPSTIGEWLGINMDAGLGNGLLSGLSSLSSTTSYVGEQGIVSPIGQKIEKAKSMLSNFGNKVKSFFTSLTNASAAASSLSTANARAEQTALRTGKAIGEESKQAGLFAGITNQLSGILGDLNFNLDDLTQGATDATGAAGGLNDQLDYMGGAGGGSGTGSAGRAAGSVGDLNDALGNVSTPTLDTSAAMTGLNTSMTPLPETATKTKSALQELTDSIKQSRKVVDEFNLGDLINPAKVLTNIQSNINGIKEWSSNFTKLQKLGASKQLLKYLKSLGLEGANVVQSFANMTKAELMEANKLFKELEKQPKKAAKNIQKQIKKATNSTKKNLKKGLALDTSTMDDDMFKLGKNAIHALNSSLDIHSPSGEAEKSANFLMLGFLNRIKKGIDQVGLATEEVGESAITGLNDTVSSGLTSNLTDIMTKFADSMKIGSTKIEHSMLDSLVSTIGKLSNFLTDNLDLNPIITPRIDFTQLRADISTMGSMFGSTLAMAGGYGITPWGMSTNAENLQNERASQGDSNTEQLASDIVNAINQKLEPVGVKVDVEYDENSLLRVVARQNASETKRTGYNILSRQQQKS